MDTQINCANEKGGETAADIYKFASRLPQVLISVQWHPLTNTFFIYISVEYFYLFIYLFGVLHRFQHCTGHITTGSWKGRGNQYIQFVRILYCKLPTNGKQLPTFPLEAARVLPLCHCRPQETILHFIIHHTTYLTQIH